MLHRRRRLRPVVHLHHQFRQPQSLSRFRRQRLHADRCQLDRLHQQLQSQAHHCSMDHSEPVRHSRLPCLHLKRLGFRQHHRQGHQQMKIRLGHQTWL